MSGSFRTRPLSSTPASGTASRDLPLPADATDTISSVRWSPVASHLAAGSWDGKVRVYDVATDGSARGIALLSAAGPVLSCDWNKVS